MDAGTRRFVRERAGERCEYCRLHQRNSELLHYIEHVIARQHGGSDDVDNLALACHRCNLHKGPNLTGVDPQATWRFCFTRGATNGSNILRFRARI